MIACAFRVCFDDVKVHKQPCWGCYWNLDVVFIIVNFCDVLLVVDGQ